MAEFVARREDGCAIVQRESIGSIAVVGGVTRELPGPKLSRSGASDVNSVVPTRDTTTYLFP